MAGLLRQLVEASQLQAVAEPWVARARGHRIWTPRGDCQSLPGAVRGQDRQDEDRLREGSGGDGLAGPQGCLIRVRAWMSKSRYVGNSDASPVTVHTVVVSHGCNALQHTGKAL